MKVQNAELVCHGFFATWQSGISDCLLFLEESVSLLRCARVNQAVVRLRLFFENFTK
jgi:hypothetical protein